MCLIEIKSLNKTFSKGNSKTIALKDVNLKINKGELVAIVGTSGSGKSTLLNIIGWLDSPSSGEYLLNSKDISNLTQKELAKIRNKTFGFIVQYFAILADEPTGALDSKTSQQVIDILKELNKEGKTIIIVTHDDKIAMQCDKILNIEDGCIKTQVNIFNQAQNISL